MTPLISEKIFETQLSIRSVLSVSSRIIGNLSDRRAKERVKIRKVTVKNSRDSSMRRLFASVIQSSSLRSPTSLFRILASSYLFA